MFIMCYMLAIELAGTILGASLIRRLAKINFVKSFIIMGLAMSVSWFLGLMAWNPFVAWEYTGLVGILAFISLLWGLAGLIYLRGYGHEG